VNSHNPFPLSGFMRRINEAGYEAQLRREEAERRAREPLLPGRELTPTEWINYYRRLNGFPPLRFRPMP
jgi:hypothetical protein